MDRKAIALGYEPGEGAPRVLAAARGYLAEKIINMAEEMGISLYKDPDLASALYAVRSGDEVPERLFAAVAEALAYCYRINEDFRNKIAATDR